MSYRLAGNDQHSLEFSLASTVLASTIATIALHGLLAHEGADHDVHFDLGSTTTISSTFEGDPITVNTAGKPGFVTVTDQREGPSKVLVQGDIGFATSPYARDFKAPKPTQESTRWLATSVQGLKAEGYTNLSVTIQGEASAEDSRTAKDAGVTTPSAVNARLATARGEVLQTYIAAHKSLPKDVDVQTERGKEVNLTQHQLTELKAIAHDSHFKSVAEMINAYDDGTALSADAKRTLDGYLGNHRGAHVTIRGNTLVPGTTVATDRQERVCLVPQVGVEKIYKTSHPIKRKLPWVLPIPIIFPIIRRRLKLNTGSLNTRTGQYYPGRSYTDELKSDAYSEGFRGGSPDATQPAPADEKLATVIQFPIKTVTPAETVAPEQAIDTAEPEAVAADSGKSSPSPETPMTPPAEESFAGTPAEKITRRWLILPLAAAVALGGVGVAIYELGPHHDGTATTTRIPGSPAAPIVVNPCDGLKRVTKVVGKVSTTYVDGVARKQVYTKAQ